MPSSGDEIDLGPPSKWDGWIFFGLMIAALVAVLASL